MRRSQDHTTDSDASTIAGVRLSHPDKILFPEQGITKRDLASYLEAAAPRMLPHIANRLLSFVRCPQGRVKQCFFQRHPSAGISAKLKALSLSERQGGRRSYIYLTDLPGLVAAAQIGVLEFHMWGSRIDDLERPDRIVFDLDPDPSVTFGKVKKAAALIRDSLDASGLISFPLLTGGKGLHIVVPIRRQHRWPAIKAFAGSLARHIAAEAPSEYVATMSRAKREGRIFIDYLRNDRGSTAIAPYSTRARPGAPIAWPVSWDQLETISLPNAVNISNVAKWLRQSDSWGDYAMVRQSLKISAFRQLGISP